MTHHRHHQHGHTYTSPAEIDHVVRANFRTWEVFFTDGRPPRYVLMTPATVRAPINGDYFTIAPDGTEAFTYGAAA